ASNLAGPVAPGELVVLYGNGLGGVRTVLFNGVAGPVLYATPGQGGAVAPYAVAGGSQQVVVQSAGAASAPVAVAVAATAPGVFTANSSGRRGAARGEKERGQKGGGEPGGGGFLVVPLCDWRGADLAGGAGRETGGGAAAAAGGSGHGGHRRGGRGGKLRGRGSGSDRRRDAGECGGARRGLGDGAGGVDGGRSRQPGRGDGGGTVGGPYRMFGLRFSSCRRRRGRDRQNRTSCTVLGDFQLNAGGGRLAWGRRRGAIRGG